MFQRGKGGVNKSQLHTKNDMQIAFLGLNGLPRASSLYGVDVTMTGDTIIDT